MSLYKYLIGREFKDDFQRESLDSIIQGIKDGAASGFPLRELGDGSEVAIRLSEEARESHLHILGATRQGKSKFLEMLIRQDIDNGYGACLLDPSDNADTVYKVLKYAIKKGYDKIVLIDPFDWQLKDKEGKLVYGRVPSINPIHYTAPASAIIGNLMDAMRVLWNQPGFDQTPRINKYLPAVLRALHAGGYTLPDVKFFMDRTAYEPQMTQILDSLPVDNLQRNHIVSSFKSVTLYEQFQSTVNRLEPVIEPTIELLLGARQGLDFRKLIRDKYLILLNLTYRRLYSKEHQRLVGTIVLSEIDYAVQSLNYHGWKGRYYVYIDECGDYATESVKEILDKRAKSGISFTLSHQGFDQLPKDIASSVMRGTGNKLLFNTRDPDDRMKMIRSMYGGDLSDRDVSWTLSQLTKQKAVIKIGVTSPVSFRVKDTPDEPVSKDELREWKKQHYTSNLYQPVEQVREEIKNRFASSNTTSQKSIRRDNFAPQTGSNPKASKRGARNDRPATSDSSPVRGDRPENQADTHQAQPSGQGQDLRVPPDLHPDYSDAKPFRRRRPSNEEQGDKREGGES